MLHPGKHSPAGIALYHDVGYGLRKDVSQQSRKFRSPAVYSKTRVDYDNWDLMFMERLLGGITMHKPLVPPGVVLTLGNGSDFWAIRAAQEWPQSRITVHSLFGVYRDGMGTLIRSMGLADRVSYVRGDPSRDLHLDYPSDTFDMVRLSYCSLNLAESEWYIFLQEVNRVLKPRGVLEVIDEDLLFPGHKPMFNGDETPIRAFTQAGNNTGLTASPLHWSFMRNPDPSSVDVKTTSLITSVHAGSQYDMNESAGLPPSLDAIEIVDHSRLIRAWREMLMSRWISASITSVLPFYLSAIFHNFRALPALEILTGPSSLSPFPSQQFQQSLDPEPFRHLRHATVKDDADSSVTWLPKNEAPPHFIPSHASMHLARMVAIMTSCKEAIWGAYNKLFCEHPRSPRPNDASGKTNKFTMREEFECCWFNWECDMRLRVDMASNINKRLHWAVPSPQPDPVHERWLECVTKAQEERGLVGIASPQPDKPEVIRCVRGFVAWKSSGSGPETNPGASFPGMSRRSIFS